MNMNETLIGLTLAVGLVVWANWKSRRPNPNFEVRLVPYNALQFLGVLLALLFLAHLLTLMTGQVWQSRRGF